MPRQRNVIRYGPFSAFIANAVRDGEWIYLSGQVSIGDDGQVVAPNDFLAQMRKAYENIAEVLGKLDATMGDIIDETMFITDAGEAMADLEGFARVRSEAYGRQPDVTQTMVQVAALAMPELKIEIKVVARV